MTDPTEDKTRPASAVGTASALQDAVLVLVTDSDIRDKAWLRFTDDQTFSDAEEPIARLSFTAGYLTAMDHVGRLLGAIVPPPDGPS